ncbi:MAG: glycosyltransferase family 2 protein [Elusimicrobia bacterium]|nr:glycosyltransferase family 2 protein [Elusimicrobiota bacterium]
MKTISIVMPCYNEELNVEKAYKAVKDIFSTSGDYNYEHIFIDNASEDGTFAILKKIAVEDKKVKLIRNVRNFGHIRSPFHGLLQTSGDAVILMVADLQDPPELIAEFIKKWEGGSKIVVGIKTDSDENGLIFGIRKFYYRIMNRISEVRHIENFTGFGLYDKQVIEILRGIDDPYPYFRGLIADIGFEISRVEYIQPARKSGITKNNFYTLYDMAMLGLTNYSKIPLRIATFLGFAMSLISLLVALSYLVYKLIYWQEFSLGIAPIVIGLFFMFSVQLFFLGVVGEYIGSIHTKVLKRPLVVERERINF